MNISSLFGPPSADEIEPMTAVLEQALVFPVGAMAPWLNTIGYEHARVVRRNNRVVAGLSVIPFGHWFGGNVVPAAGVTAVGVAPDQRGSGVGLWMIQRMLEEQRAKGMPIATLYPATTAFYRRAGFERAAQRIIYEMPLGAIGIRDHTLEAAPVEAGSYDLLKKLYTAQAACSSSRIERPSYYWDRILELKDKPSYKVVVSRDGVPEGYVIFGHAVWDEPLVVRDIVAQTPQAGRRLLSVLADHRSVVDTVRFPGGPHDPLLFLMPEQKQKVHNAIDLMLRILDVPGALAARGYLPGVHAEIHLSITDDLFPDNNQRFVLHVAEGRGHAEPGGEGRLKLHIRDLAALYSGYYTALELQHVSDIGGSQADLVAATLAFSGPRPWLPDMF